MKTMRKPNAKRALFSAAIGFGLFAIGCGVAPQGLQNIDGDGKATTLQDPQQSKLRLSPPAKRASQLARAQRRLTHGDPALANPVQVPRLKGPDTVPPPATSVDPFVKAPARVPQLRDALLLKSKGLAITGTIGALRWDFSVKMARLSAAIEFEVDLPKGAQILQPWGRELDIKELQSRGEMLRYRLTYPPEYTGGPKHKQLHVIYKGKEYKLELPYELW